MRLFAVVALPGPIAIVPLAAVAFAEGKAREVFGRDDVPQTLRIHTNALNADVLDTLLARLRARGYDFITLDAAMRDEAMGTPDDFVGRFGPTWLFRWSQRIAPSSSFRRIPTCPRGSSRPRPRSRPADGSTIEGRPWPRPSCRKSGMRIPSASSPPGKHSSSSAST